MTIEVRIPPLGLEGELTLPDRGQGLVIFAHGSGSSRSSPRNRFVAGELQRIGLGTLLFDLLLEHEDRDRQYVFDIDLLARRLVEATVWASSQPETSGAPIGYFGASTGAAAALVAAATSHRSVAAIVSRGGRPDLAGPALPHVRAATLLIVGGEDQPVLGLNREAFNRLDCEKALRIVPGAGHLFEERGTLAEVVALAGAWLEPRLARAATSS